MVFDQQSFLRFEIMIRNLTQNLANNQSRLEKEKLIFLPVPVG